MTVTRCCASPSSRREGSLPKTPRRGSREVRNPLTSSIRRDQLWSLLPHDAHRVLAAARREFFGDPQIADSDQAIGGVKQRHAIAPPGQDARVLQQLLQLAVMRIAGRLQCLAAVRGSEPAARPAGAPRRARRGHRVAHADDRAAGRQFKRLRDLPRPACQPARTADARACNRAVRDDGAPRTPSHSTHGSRSSRAISMSCSIAASLRVEGARMRLLANPVAQHIAPTRGCQRASCRHARGRNRPRRLVEIGGGELVEQPAGFAQVRSRASRCVSRGRPTLAQRRQHAMAQEVAIEGACSSLEGSSSHCSCSRARPLFQLCAREIQHGSRKPTAAEDLDGRHRRSVRAARRRASAPAASFPADRRRDER